MKSKKINLISSLKVGVLTILIVSLFLFVGCQNNMSNLNEEKGTLLKGQEITVYKSPNCGCCVGYIEALKKKGVKVKVISDDSKLNEIKKEFNIPRNAMSCHTSVLDNGKFIEGHVPFEAVEKLLSENSNVDGISLPGMPPGSIGMGGSKRGDFVVLGINGENIEEFMRI